MDKAIIVIIRDMVADECSAPLVLANEACAIRYFNNIVTQNVEDYQIIKIGEYDSKKGDITILDKVILNKGE